MQPQHLFIYYLAAIMVPNIALCFTEHMPVLADLCNLILPASVFAWLFTLKRKPGMMIWILFPLVFFAAFQLVLLYLFGNSIIAVDMLLNVVTTNFDEASTLLYNLIPIVAGVFILYLPALIFGIISMVRKDKLTKEFTQKARKYSYIGMIAGALLLGINTVTDKEYDFKTDIFPINVCYNVGLAVERTYDFSHYPETSADFTYNARSEHEKDSAEVYVFVIGETGRACNWGVYGYERNTTPLIQKRKNAVCFTDVLTQSNTTHISVPMLMSLASAENYDRIYKEKSIITAFKEAGFYTAFFSNQRYNHSFIDVFGSEAHVDKFLKEDAGNDNISDEALLGMIDKMMAEGHRKLFIVLHTYGSHFKYNERYDRSEAVFVPDDISNVSKDSRPNLINAYDNTVLQTDKFLDGIISRLEKKGVASAMFYTSDHGEDIFDDSRNRFLHSSPIPTYYQLHVPLVIWTSETYSELYPEIVKNISANRNKPAGSNASASHTMLQIAGIATPLRTDSLSLADKNYHVDRRHFINDHNEPVEYDKLGMRKQDIKMFKKHGITYR